MAIAAISFRAWESSYMSNTFATQQRRQGERPLLQCLHRAREIARTLSLRFNASPIIQNLYKCNKIELLRIGWKGHIVRFRDHTRKKRNSGRSGERSVILVVKAEFLHFIALAPICRSKVDATCPPEPLLVP